MKSSKSRGRRMASRWPPEVSFHVTDTADGGLRVRGRFLGCAEGERGVLGHRFGCCGRASRRRHNRRCAACNLTSREPGNPSCRWLSQRKTHVFTPKSRSPRSCRLYASFPVRSERMARVRGTAFEGGREVVERRFAADERRNATICGVHWVSFGHRTRRLSAPHRANARSRICGVVDRGL